VHRIGRTGRAGASGDAISVYSDKDERLLADIEKLIKQTVQRGELSNFTPRARSRDRDSERTERRPRSAEPARGDAGRGDASRGERGERPARSYGAGPSPRREKIDPWFLKPYEPSSAPRREAVQGTAGSPAKPKQKLAALLGGLPKPQA